MDSFGLDLPVLDSSLVESVFRELEDENLPSSNDRAQITGKERYFQETKGTMEEQEVQENSPKICHQLDENISGFKKSEEKKNNKSQNEYSSGLENDAKNSKKVCTQGYDRTPVSKLQKANVDMPIAVVNQSEQSVRGDMLCLSSEQPLQHHGEINFHKSKDEINTSTKISTASNCSVKDNDNFNIKQENQDVCLEQGHETDNGSSDPAASSFCSQDAFKEEERKSSQDSETHLHTNVCQSENKRIERTTLTKAEVSPYVLDGTAPQESGESQLTVKITIAENSLSVLDTKENTPGRKKISMESNEESACRSKRGEQGKRR